MNNTCESKSNRPWHGRPDWQYELTIILLEFGAAQLSDLLHPDDDSDKKVLVASRVRLKYVVRRIRQLKRNFEEPQFSEQVHDFLDQARLQMTTTYWREVDQEYHTRGVDLPPIYVPAVMRV